MRMRTIPSPDVPVASPSPTTPSRSPSPRRPLSGVSRRQGPRRQKQTLDYDLSYLNRLKLNALRTISDHLIAGRWSEVRTPSEKELKATAVLEFSIEEASAKVRTGPPIDDAEDYSLPVWAGVVPLEMKATEPIADSTDAIPMPEYVRRYRRT